MAAAVATTHRPHVLKIAGMEYTCTEANPGNGLDFERRFGRITASVTSTILGSNRFARAPSEALLQIFQCSGFSGNEYTHAGHAAESFIINNCYKAWLESSLMEESNKERYTIGYDGFQIHPVLRFISSTSDFTIHSNVPGEDEGVGECKYVAGRSGPYAVKLVESDGTPKHIAQRRIQLMCKRSAGYHDMIIAGWKDYKVDRIYQRDTIAWWRAENPYNKPFTNGGTIRTFYEMYLRWFWEGDVQHSSYMRTRATLLDIYKIPKETVTAIMNRRADSDDVRHMRLRREKDKASRQTKSKVHTSPPSTATQTRGNEPLL